jgi:hypothetical protein
MSALALFFRLRRLVANVGLVKGVLGEDAVKAGHATFLLNLLESLNSGLKLIDELHGLDLIDLVKISVTTLHDFDQNQSLNDGVSSRFDDKALVFGLVEHSKSVAEVLLDLAS